MEIGKQKLSKKQLKNYINKKGGFINVKVDVSSNSFSEEAELRIRQRFAGDEAKIQEILQNAVYIRGISSTGELNRNGYIIEESAWINAIPEYLNKNPLVLLQHESEEIIGETFNAEVTSEGLVSEMYIFLDQMNEMNQKRFNRGQLKALSTGHITTDAVFENEETGERLTPDEFMQLPFAEQMSNVWVMIVTALEWVEQSLVSIPSNRQTFITKRNSILNYMKNTLGADVPEDFEADEDFTQEEPKEPETPEAVDPAEEQKEMNGEELMKDVEDHVQSLDIESNEKEDEKEVVEPIEEVDQETNSTDAESGNDTEEGENPETDTEESGNDEEVAESAKDVEAEAETQENGVKRTLVEKSREFRNGLIMRINEYEDDQEEQVEVGEETKDVEEDVEGADGVVESTNLNNTELIGVLKEMQNQLKENNLPLMSSKDISTESFESMVEDLKKNNLNTVAEKIESEFNSLREQREEAIFECNKYKEIVNKAPLMKSFKVVGQKGVITPDIDKAENKSDTSDEPTLADKIKQNGGKIVYKPKKSKFSN